MCESFLSLLLNLHQRKRQLFVKIIEFQCVIAFFRHFIACFPFFLIHLVLSLLSISSQISDLFNEAVLDSFACFFVFVLMDFHCLSHQFQMISYILKELCSFPLLRLVSTHLWAQLVEGWYYIHTLAPSVWHFFVVLGLVLCFLLYRLVYRLWLFSHSALPFV